MKSLGRVSLIALAVVIGTVIGLVVGAGLAFPFFPHHSDPAPGDGIILLALWLVTVPLGIAGSVAVAFAFRKQRR